MLCKKCLDSQLSKTYIMKLYWLKGLSNLVLVPFQPSEQLSHIKIGCSGDRGSRSSLSCQELKWRKVNADRNKLCPIFWFKLDFFDFHNSPASYPRGVL